MIPIIDWNDKDIVPKMYNAYSTCGFAVFTNCYNQWLPEFEDWKQLMQEFFNLPLETKQKNKYSGVEDNIGYHWMGFERTNPDSPGDLKETYNWVTPDRMTDQYYPLDIPEFKPMAQKILRIAELLSYDFIYMFEEMFELPRGKLVEEHLHGNSTMRMIRYPSYDEEIQPGQIRGSSHTDYGTCTLLWRFDDTPGLQVYDRKDKAWIDVPVVENSIVMNTGDLLQRWTNDTLKSTPHRVINSDMTKDRISMPYFVDAGRRTIVKNITNEPAKYDPINAYEYLKWRLSLSHDTDYIPSAEIAELGEKHIPKNQDYEKYN